MDVLRDADDPCAGILPVAHVHAAVERVLRAPEGSRHRLALELGGPQLDVKPHLVIDLADGVPATQPPQPEEPAPAAHDAP